MIPRLASCEKMSIFYLACLAEATGLRLALSETQETGFLASCLDSSRTNISSATNNNIKTNIMRRLFFRSDILTGITLFDCALHRLIHKSFVTMANRAGERRVL